MVTEEGAEVEVEEEEEEEEDETEEEDEAKEGAARDELDASMELMSGEEEITAREPAGDREEALGCADRDSDEDLRKEISASSFSLIEVNLAFSETRFWRDLLSLFISFCDFILLRRDS